MVEFGPLSPGFSTLLEPIITNEIFCERLPGKMGTVEHICNPSNSGSWGGRGWSQVLG